VAGPVYRTRLLFGMDSILSAGVAAIRGGDIPALQALVDAHPALINVRGPGGRTALHVATDWPGYFPNGPAVVRLLIAAGADPNVRSDGDTGETPLHWAASSDDVDVAAALLEGGADPEVPGGSIGTPLDNAIGYGCWHVARLLVERGARIERLWQAAALGRLDRVEALAGDATPEQISEAFWQACSGGQRRTAEYLLARGADVNAIPSYSKQTALGAAGSIDTRRDQLVTWLREHGAR
jgi:ankyrin repeat protein